MIKDSQLLSAEIRAREVVAGFKVPSISSAKVILILIKEVRTLKKVLGAQMSAQMSSEEEKAVDELFEESDRLFEEADKMFTASDKMFNRANLTFAKLRKRGGVFKQSSGGGTHRRWWSSSLSKEK